jgi:O-antigen/teichoic acid export membrane protein
LLKGFNFSELRKWFSQYAWVFILDFFSKCFGYLLLPMYLTYMTQKQFGTYTYIFYIITTASNVFNLGFGTSTSKLFNDYEENRGSYLFSINLFIFSFLGLVLGLSYLTRFDFFIMNFLIDDKDFQYENFRLSFLFYITYLVVYGQLSVYFQFTNQINKFQWFNLFRILIMNLIAVYYVKYALFDKTASTRLNVEVILSWIIFLPLCYNYIKQFKIKFDWSPIKRSLIIGLPVIASSLASIFYTVSDKYFLQKNESIEVLAVYNLSLFLTTPLGFILTTFNLVWLPAFFREKSIEVNFKRTKLICTILGILFIIGSFFIGIIVYILVKFKGIPISYSNSLILFPFIVISITIEAFCQLLNNFIILLESTWFTLLITLLIGGMMYFLSRWIVPEYGIEGTVFILILLSLFRFSSLLIYIIKRLKEARISN